MRVAAAFVARAGADAIDLNMGCPVPKVCKTGAGAALLDDPDRAVAVARAARQGSGLPVTVKLRSGRRPGDTSGFELARRLVEEAGVSAIAFHPRSAAVQHKGVPDYELAARLVEALDVPVILTGGLHDAAGTLAAFDRTGATAVMLARGSLGNPWLFEQLLGARDGEPTRAEVLDELDWTIDRAVEHLGEPGPRATCASSTPGTSRGWAWRRPKRRPWASRYRGPRHSRTLAMLLRSPRLRGRWSPPEGRAAILLRSPSPGLTPPAGF